VTAFETGANRWQKLKAWPEATRRRRCILKPGMKLGIHARWKGMPSDWSDTVRRRGFRV
jgi:predicted acyl esterase